MVSLLIIDAKNYFLNFFSSTHLPDEDANIIISWLTNYFDCENSYKTYRVVVFRFHIWLKYNKLRLKQLQRTDILHYVEFLRNPDPEWCGERQHFNSGNWRPFRQGLSVSSIKYNIQVLKQLFNYLYNIRYIENRFFYKQLRLPNACKKPVDNKYITIQELEQIFHFINQIPEDSDVVLHYKMRTKWIFKLLYYTACRRSEVVNATMDDFFIQRRMLWLKVNGKGGKCGKLPVPQKLETALNEYREYYQLPPIYARNDSEAHIPIIIKDSPMNGKYCKITTQTLWYIVTSTCKAMAIYQNDEIFAHKLVQITPHWLRHTSASHQMDSGIDIRVIAENLRHSSFKTTMLYLHTDQDQRHEETISKFGCLQMPVDNYLINIIIFTLLPLITSKLLCI